MSLPILISNRLVKFTGNIVKTFAYVFHFLLPNKRFTIPKQCDPALTVGTRNKIPKILWQTNYTNVVSLPVYINFLFNRFMSRECEYRYASDDDILEFFETHASTEELESYKKLNDGAAKADFWRLVVLYHIGGIYLDMDASFVWPLSKQIKEDESEVFLLNKEHYTNYFMATAPKNEILKKAIDIVVSNIEDKKVEGGVYYLTGPGVLNEAIAGKKVNSRFYRYVCVQGAFTNEYFHYIDKKQGKWIHTEYDSIIKE